MNPIDFLSSFLSNIIRIEPRTGGNPLSFYVGEILPGKFVRQIDDHHAMVQLKGHPLLVESHLHLPAHWEGYLRVETTHPQVFLKLVSEVEEGTPQICSWLKKYLPHHLFLEDLPGKLSVLCQREAPTIPPQLRETIDHLFSLWNRLSLQPPSPLDPGHLQKLISQSGLFLEHKLKHLIETHGRDQCDQMVRGDMKGLLIKLREQLKSFSAMGRDPGKDLSNIEEIEDVVNALERILHKIEGYQILNLIPTDFQRKIFLLLPIWFQNNLQFAEMNISLPHSDSGRSESGETSILFLLDMPAWGKMIIEVKIKGEGLYCHFQVTRPEVSAFLNSALSELKGRLIQMGFKAQLNISLETPEEMTQMFFNDIGEGSESLLNIII